MALTADGLNAAASGIASVATYLGLVDDVGTELTGGSPAYARKPVTWTSPVGGLIRPTADADFNVPPATTVGGWRTYSASTAGTNYGGEDLTNETFTGQGTYTLLAASTGIDVD